LLDNDFPPSPSWRSRTIKEAKAEAGPKSAIEEIDSYHILGVFLVNSGPVSLKFQNETTIRRMMIYGQRFFEKNSTTPATSDFSTTREFASRKQKSVRLLYRAFQFKYTLYLLAAVAGSVAIFMMPTWYFINQNYEIFQRLAYDTQPQLLEHLEREKTWILFLFCFAEISTIAFSAWIGLRITTALVGPIWALERHMKKVTLGDWAAEDFRIRSTDDFRSLANTYSYLYRSIRAQTESEIKMLEKLVIDPKEHENYSTWKSLLDSKKQQLGWSDPMPSGSGAWTSSSLPKRRAS
jgi:hypothetical protein